MDPLAQRGRTPLDFAARNGHAEAVNALLKGDADTDAQTTDIGRSLREIHHRLESTRAGRTPLHSAAVKGHQSAVEALLAGGAEVMAQEKNGAMPLHDAAEEGHASVVRRRTD